MDAILFFKGASPLFFYSIIASLGLSIGSFLNVLIYRLPIIMEDEWADDADFYLDSKSVSHDEIPRPDKRFCTLWGRSFCTTCDKPVPGWLNVPVLAWVFLRGKSKCCNTSFSVRYPLIELITGAVTVGLFSYFNIIEAASLSAAFYFLIAMAMIDKDTMLLPDKLVLPLLWLGLIVNSFNTFVPLDSAIYGAVTGYLFMTIVPAMYGKITGRPGLMMGQGDVKLIAAAGAWLGISMLPFVFVIGTVVTVILMTTMGSKFIKNNELLSERPLMPFGPGLSAGIFICLIAQESIKQYFNII